MTEHICPRCGFEDECRYGNWPDRHPVAATVGGCFVLTLMAMMFSVHPLASAAMTVVAAAAVAVRWAGRERRRRAGLAARADYDHATLMARSLPQPIQLPAPAPLPPTRRYAPATTPIRTRR